jgi:predicted kinase
MAKVTVLRGVPGAGKSTYLRTLPQAQVVSRDQFFIDGDGVFRFQASRAAEAKARCLRAYAAALVEGHQHVVVDDTNLTLLELAPYCALALASGYDLEVLTLQIEPEIAMARCGRDLSADCMRRMVERLDQASAELPPYWPHRVVTRAERELPVRPRLVASRSTIGVAAPAAVAAPLAIAAVAGRR